MGIRCAKFGLRVLIVCPTGQLVYSFKSQLPDVDGIENVQVDTIHGVLGYKRTGADEKVQWAPPSALRRIDVILIDEASQYDNREWQRFTQCVAEQPHLLYVLAVADFQRSNLYLMGVSATRCCCPGPGLRSTRYIGPRIPSTSSSSTVSASSSPPARCERDCLV